MMSKKPWEKPMLIVLVRGKVEENVLCVCKEPAGRRFFHKCVPAQGPHGGKSGGKSGGKWDKHWGGHGRPSRRIGKS